MHTPDTRPHTHMPGIGGGHDAWQRRSCGTTRCRRTHTPRGHSGPPRCTHMTARTHGRYSPAPPSDICMCAPADKHAHVAWRPRATRGEEEHAHSGKKRAAARVETRRTCCPKKPEAHHKRAARDEPPGAASASSAAQPQPAQSEQEQRDETLPSSAPFARSRWRRASASLASSSAHTCSRHVGEGGLSSIICMSATAVRA